MSKVKKALTSSQAARIRWEIKTGTKNVSVKRRAALADYDAGVRADPEVKADDAAPDDTAAAKDAAPDPAPAPEPEPDSPPNVEPPPRVADVPVNVAGGTAKASNDWREKHRTAIAFTGDGRQMFCESIGDMIVQGLGALRDETGKVTNPKVPDPRIDAMRSLFVLAIDDIAPDRARLTPRVGAALVTIGTLGERAYHAKKIAEYLKTSPDHQAWLRKQGERERAEADLQRDQAERAAREAGARDARADMEAEAKPQYAEPPPPPAQTNGVHAPPPQRTAPAAAQKSDPDDVLC